MRYPRMGRDINRKMSWKVYRDTDDQELMTSTETLHRAKHEDLDHDKDVTRCPQLAFLVTKQSRTWIVIIGGQHGKGT